MPAQPFRGPAGAGPRIIPAKVGLCRQGSVLDRLGMAGAGAAHQCTGTPLNKPREPKAAAFRTMVMLWIGGRPYSYRAMCSRGVDSGAASSKPQFATHAPRYDNQARTRPPSRACWRELGVMHAGTVLRGRFPLLLRDEGGFIGSTKGLPLAATPPCTTEHASAPRPAHGASFPGHMSIIAS